MSVSKPNSRFLPTLTEVVVPVAAAKASVVNEQLLVERVLQVVMPAMDEKINAAMLGLVQQHLAAVLPDLLLQIEDLVRAAVVQSVSAATRSDMPSTE